MTRTDKVTVLIMAAVSALVPIAGGLLLAATDAHAKPATVTLNCGAYDVTLQPHDNASRPDAFEAAARINQADSAGCTLVPSE